MLLCALDQCNEYPQRHLESLPLPQMPTPLISVILGTYNAEKHIDRALRCVFQQTFSDYEIIVVDDASRDKTLSLLEAYGDRIRIIRRAQNSATCELPRYQGVKEANGTYCAFLDADDLWEPQFLERTVQFLQLHPDIPLVHTYVQVIDGEDRVLRIRHEGGIPQGPQIARELLSHCFITISAVVVLRSVWLEAVAENEIMDFGMDLDFFLSIARRYPIGFIPEVLASYRRSSASVSVQKWKRIPRNVVTLERLFHKGCWKGIASRREMKRILLDAYVENAEYSRSKQVPFRTLWFVCRGLRFRPWCWTLWKNGLASLLDSLMPRE